MYLTILPKIIGDDYRIHQKVRELFPGDQRVLFQQSDDVITVISANKPVGDLATKEVDESVFVSGSKFAFTARLNPAKRDIKTRKKIPIDNDAMKPWIERQLNKIGADVKFQYVKEGMRRSLKQNKTVSFISVLCFGFLTIKDTDIFVEALKKGIGSGKGFGFGLLNVFS